MNVFRRKIPTRRIGIAFHDHSFRMIQVGQASIIPAGICYTGSIPGSKGVDRPCEVLPPEVTHLDCRVVWSPDSFAIFELCLVRALVIIRLRDEYREGDVMSPDIGPSDILCQTLPPNPGLESRSIDGIDDCHVVEFDVGDVRKRALILTQRADTHPMALVPDCSTLEENIMGARLNCDGVVTIENKAVQNFDVCAGHIKSIRIEGKASSCRESINHSITDRDIISNKLHTPSNWLL